MLQSGKNITQLNDPLVRIQPDYLYHAIKSPKPEVEAAIRQLRMVASIDQNRYRQLKKLLPYVTCGIFNPPFRRTENFGWINHFILDIDHIGQKELNTLAIKTTLAKDSRVKMVFISPGEDGLKVLFALKEKCYDPAQFSLFYKIFAKSFSEMYQLQQVIDQRTSDVARACFISHDPEVWFNPNTDPIDMSTLVDFSNPYNVLELQHEIRQFNNKTADEESVSPKEVRGPDDDTLAAIKARLNPSFRAKREKIIFVPEEMENTIEQIVACLNGNGINTHEIINIHYGKKFRCRFGNKEAEVNVFYGKRGFSVVQSPRHGTSSELNQICAQLISELLI